MPSFRKSELKVAGDYLLRMLPSEGPVLYSRFYDGSSETHEALLREMGLREGEFGSPEWTMDFALAELEKAGLVATQTTGELLADGNRDYGIALTDEGRAFLAEGKEFVYSDIDPYENAVPALPWRPTKNDPNDKYPGDEEFSVRKITASINGSTGWMIEGKPFGAVGLELGSAILVFGKRRAGLDDPNDALLHRQLAFVLDGLSGAGAEEICHLLFGGGYLVLAKPEGIPLYDVTSVEPEKFGRKSPGLMRC